MLSIFNRSWIFLAVGCLASVTSVCGKMHGVSMHGNPKYGPKFLHYDFVNPTAPKGGKITIGEIGSFDSLIPWIIKGVSAKRISLTRATLLTRSPEEPFTMYGAVAESIELPEDRSWVIFNIRPEARWDHGKTITADDVVFSYKLWLEQGQPFMKTFYSKVQKVERLSEKRVKFTFDPAKSDRELPLIMGLMPLLPKDVYLGKDLSSIALKPLVSNGPYRIKSFEPGRFVVFERVKDFWGASLPIYKGRFNFDEIRLDYYMNGAILFEAFKAGKVDVMEEDNPQKWHSDYQFPRSKKIITEEVAHTRPVGLSAFVFNTRRDIFKDKRVRQALILVFDFEHLNNTVFHGMCHRTKSFFDNTELAPQGRVTSAEKKILDQYKGKVDASVFSESYVPPANETAAKKRSNQERAIKLLKEAGWVLEKGVLVHYKTKKTFVFEILLKSKEYEKVAVEFIRNLQILGIKATVRVLDEAQYENRKKEFDYDMIHYAWLGTRSPGNELINYVSTKAATTMGSRNYAGIMDPVVDDLIEHIIRSKDRENLVSCVKALDRILMSGCYFLHLFHMKKDMVAYKEGLKHPPTQPTLESRIESWWWGK